MPHLTNRQMLDDRWRALAVQAGARAESLRFIAAQSDASYTIATDVPSRVAFSILVRRCRHGINRTGFQAVLGMSAHYDSLPRLIRKR